MTELRAGSMRDRITIQRRTSAVGTYGESTEAWSEITKRFARFEDLGGNELEQARKVYATATAKVTFRAPRNVTLTTKDRIQFGGKSYGIGSILKVGNFRDDVELLLAEIQ